MRREPAPPGGMPPPERAELGGATVELGPLAAEVADRYFAAHPEDAERYGRAGRLWAEHDTRHLLNWAFGAVDGHVELADQVAWLAAVLEARDFPLDHLASNLDLAADVVADRVAGGDEVAVRLRDAAALVRSTRTFLPG